MGPVWLSLRARLRLRWRVLAAFAVLLGVVGGVVLTAAAGARRTDTAYPRLLKWANAAQVEIGAYSSFDLNGTAGYFAGLARLPQVASMSTAVLYNMVLPVRRGLPTTWVQAFASPDGTPLALLTIPAALLLANLTAAGPGWAAAQTRPALILRSE